MRVHLQNPEGETLFSFSEPMWEAACARAGATGTGHQVSIGGTAADFAAAMTDAEAVIADAGVLRRQLPLNAPRLKLVFCTNAGLDALAPYDWLPPGALLLNNRGTHAAKSGQFGLMALLMLANRVPRMVTQQRASLWREVWGSVLARRSVTIIG